MQRNVAPIQLGKLAPQERGQKAGKNFARAELKKNSNFWDRASMKRWIVAVIPIILVAGAYPVMAQSEGATGPRWETRVADSGTRPLSGTETLRVGKDAMAATRAPGVYFAIRITRTNETIVCDKLPYTFHWDTNKAPDGWHWLELVMIDTNSDDPVEHVIDSLKVYVRNSTTTPLPPPVTAVAPVIVAPAEPVERAAQPLANRRRTPRGSSPRLPRTVALPDMATSNRIDATVADSDNPLSVPRITALCKSNGIVYLGLPDGGIASWDETEKHGKVVRLSTAAGPVRAIAAGDGMVWWTAGGTDTVYCFREKDKSVTAYNAAEQLIASVSSVGDALTSDEEEPHGPRQDAAPQVRTISNGPAWIERMAVLGKRVVLMGTSATRFLEPDGSLKTVADELPNSVAENYSDGLVQCYVGAVGGVREATLLFATPDASGSGGSLRLWSGNGSMKSDWQERGTITTSVSLLAPDPKKPVISLTPFGIAVPETTEGYRTSGVQFAAFTDKDSPANPATIPLGVTGDYNVNAPQSAELISCGGSGLWWEQNGIVFRADPFNGQRECYVPWNGAGKTITALLADKEGAFIATEKGVRRIALGNPTDTDGYGGYVRVPLGDQYTTPPTELDQKLAAGIEDWQGVTYKWGGQTKIGTDCSGFVGAMHQSVGVTLPRTSEEMGKTRQGKRVRDELHYGDTLVFPGHVALYIGNGRTAETVGGTGTGSVGKASIWRRRDVIVKRFLP